MTAGENGSRPVYFTNKRQVTNNNTKTPAIENRNLNLHFRTRKGTVHAVDNLDIRLDKGRTTVVLGESGCGKSSLARSILRLLPNNVERYSGRVLLGDEDVMQFSQERFRTEVRWTRISLVPQAAMNSLNPVIKIADQIAEPLFVHRMVRNRKEAFKRVRDVVKLVGIPEDFLHRYPFEFSGGMQQRAAIAMALVAKPEVVILDEPTSALDLLTQANIMNTLKKIKWELGITFMLITHDISTSSELADDVGVMYAAQIIERAGAGDFFKQPLHPYSRMLMKSVPTLHRLKEPKSIPGSPPDLLAPPGGCRFADRCPERFGACEKPPPMFEPERGRLVRCWLYD